MQYTDLALRVNYRTLWRLLQFAKVNSIEAETYPEQISAQSDFKMSQVTYLTNAGHWRKSTTQPRVDYVVLANVPYSLVGELRKSIYGQLLAKGTAFPQKSCAPWGKQTLRETPRFQRI